MPITINGSGTVTGISAGGLPDGVITPADLAQPLTLGTAVNLPNDGSAGTTVSYPGIPSWAKRITVLFNGVSLNGNDSFLIQIGDSGGYSTSGYTSYMGYVTSAAQGHDTSTAGFVVTCGNVSTLLYGTSTLYLISGNTWVNSAALGGVLTTAYYGFTGGGTKTLTGTLDRVRITSSVNNLFDLGSLNILYE